MWRKRVVGVVVGAIVTLGMAGVALVAPVGSAGAATSITTLKSSNWSGYADVGSAKSFSAVRAEWVQPSVTCTSVESSVEFWVGIDGISTSNPTVQKVGTVVLCLGGTPYYQSFWETYPRNAEQTVGAVSPGDLIRASVVYTHGNYSLTLSDTTHSADSFSKSEPCGAVTCENMSAEWIAENPRSGTQLLPLAQFSTWTVSHATETIAGKTTTLAGNAISGYPAVIDRIKMVDAQHAVMVGTTLPNSAGNGFQAIWKRAT